MTVWQAVRQIKFKLLARTWPDSPNGNVFANVYVTQGPAEDISPSNIRFPFAIVGVMDSTTDQDDQRYQVQRIEVKIVCQHSGDQFGEAVMIGGNRQSVGQSKGRGILEIEEQVMQALQFLDPSGALRLQLVSTGTAEAVLTQDVGYIVVRPMTFQARLTTSRVYPTPNAGKTIRYSVAGGNVTLSWTWHERFDLHAAYTSPIQLSTLRGKLTLVRKAGSSAPASLSDGTVVTLSSNAATGVVDTPGTGTWSYALFPQYDEFGDATGTNILTGTSVRIGTAATVTGIVV